MISEIKHATIAVLFLLSIIGCVKKAVTGEIISETQYNALLSFEVSTSDTHLADGVEVVETRSSNEVSLSEFELQIVKAGESNVRSNVLKKFDFETNKLYVDGLVDGSYTIYIIAASGDITEDKAAFASVTNISDSWLNFTADEIAPLKAKYYKGSIDFDVVNGSLSNSISTITLKNLTGSTTFKTKYNSDLTERATTQIDVSSDDFVVCSSFNVAAEGGNPKGIEKFVLTESETSILLPPTEGGADIEWQLNQFASGPYYDSFETKHKASSNIESSRAKVVNININHKYDEYGVIYHTKAAAENFLEGDTKLTKIFTKDEDETYYIYDARLIKMSKMNTTVAVASSVKPTFKTTFFNLRGIADVGLYAKIDGSNDRYHIAQFDSLPPLVEMTNMTIEPGSRILKTENDEWHRVEISSNSTFSDFDVAYSENDPFSKLITEITVNWSLGFHKSTYYAAFDNGEDAREALAMFMNMAWMNSQDDWWVYLRSSLEAGLGRNYKILWDDYDEELDFDVYKAFHISYEAWRIGRVPDGHGVAGYGQYGYFSILNGYYSSYYTNSGYYNTMSHEMGHGCNLIVNRNHICNLVTHGNSVPSNAANYWVANMDRFPIPSRTPMNSLKTSHDKKN